MSALQKEKISKDLFYKKEKEKEIVNLMIDIYCKGKKHSSGGICPECIELKDYVDIKVDRCPVMESKSFCSSCSIHCYEPFMREEIKKVMRYSGPRMLFHHPILAIKHMLDLGKAKTN